MQLPRAYYAAAVPQFLSDSDKTVLGALVENSDVTVELEQRNAWMGQMEILRETLTGLDGWLFLEFNIPRMGRRIDAVYLSHAVIFVIEFKVGEGEYRREDLNQVWDYALDLKYFHKASHMAPLIPILVATEASEADTTLPQAHDDFVYPPVRSNATGLRCVIEMGLAATSGQHIDGIVWGSAPYHPTPTIIEAAKALYAKHSVEAIARYDAGARNLGITSRRIEQIIDESRERQQKAICLVTGVPGAGKTLVGLNVATQRGDTHEPTHAVFLSGNGPLVAVLREALTRDELSRRRQCNDRTRKKAISKSVESFIQNVHHFRDEALRDSRPPIDHVVVFDEAQRAWDRHKTELFMRTKKKRAGFSMSEPEFLISCLDRHVDWAVIVCLVGGGQEINTGEAGIGAWLDAINGSFPDWQVFVSPELNDSEYAAGQAIESIRTRRGVHFNQELHLAVPMRSFRADNVSAFVKAILNCERQAARRAFENLRTRFPIALTRDLARAKQWVKERARGTERFGLVASSEAQRLKPHAIDVRVNINPVHWFLNDSTDIRSSYYLEDAATEFQVQGLELDWVCVTWDGDLRFAGADWAYHSFCGSRWQKMRKAERQNYLKNAYRVLLTRARQGMVIFIPEGALDDPTREPSFYDPTFNYLAELGIPVL
jgi:DUF2075 family protein